MVNTNKTRTQGTPIPASHTVKRADQYQRGARADVHEGSMLAHRIQSEPHAGAEN